MFIFSPAPFSGMSHFPRGGDNPKYQGCHVCGPVAVEASTHGGPHFSFAASVSFSEHLVGTQRLQHERVEVGAVSMFAFSGSPMIAHERLP